METLNNFFLAVPKMATDDYVGFTFFVGCMAMMAASAFFFLSMSSFDKKWRTSILVSGLITFIAAVHYYYMRDYWATNAESPTFFRYVDWILTVPLMCVEFYLILKAAGATKRLMWILIVASTVMLVTGYMGEGVDQANAQVWGAVSGAAYFYIVYLIWFGEAKALATSAGGETLKAHNILCKFVLTNTKKHASKPNKFSSRITVFFIIIPSIRRNSKEKRVWFNTGHGHLGWTLSAYTANSIVNSFITE